MMRVSLAPGCGDCAGGGAGMMRVSLAPGCGDCAGGGAGMMRVSLAGLKLKGAARIAVSRGLWP